MKTAQQSSGQPRASRSERFEARLTQAQKEVIVRAASLDDEAVTQFVIRSAVRAAKKRLRDEDIIQLSRNDRAALVEALVNPPAPNQQLSEAFNRYRRDHVR
jgi:uncharacterized protein (DUF1778 family)